MMIHRIVYKIFSDVKTFANKLPWIADLIFESKYGVASTQESNKKFDFLPPLR